MFSLTRSWQLNEPRLYQLTVEQLMVHDERVVEAEAVVGLGFRV
jgi:hypothetical protein